MDAEGTPGMVRGEFLCVSRLDREKKSRRDESGFCFCLRIRYHMS